MIKIRGNVIIRNAVLRAILATLEGWGFLSAQPSASEDWGTVSTSNTGSEDWGNI